jgi:two-component system sensor histidine kinase KdpD
VIRDADSVVLVDIPAAELQERLRQGKIYPPEQARRALDNFFRTEMLVRLRELALLQTATYSGGGRTSAEREEASADVRLAVAMPFAPDVARPLILRGSRLAGRMNTRWYALYVRKRREHPQNVSAAEHRRLTENVQLAMSLGATVVTREAENVADTIIEFVREEAINILVVGRPRNRGLLRRIVPGIVQQLIERAPGVDIVVVDIDEDEGERQAKGHRP